MRVRVIIFTWLAVAATPGHFLPFFYQAHGLAETQIGLIFSLSMFLSLFSTSALGAQGDHNKSKSSVISALHALRFLIFIAHLAAYPGFGYVVSLRFPYLLILGIAFRALGDPVMPILTALSITQLRTLFGPEGHLRFGEERAWGAVSWAIMAIIQGVLLDLPAIGMWVMYPIGIIVSILFSISLARFDADVPEVAESYSVIPPQMGTNEVESIPIPEQLEDVDIRNIEEGDSWASVLREIFRQGGSSCVLFFVLNFWLGAGMLIVERLMFLYFFNELSASNTLCGLTVVVTIMFEAPLFSATPALLRRFGSAPLLIVGTASFVVRVLGYALAPNAWVILLVEPLQGITYACKNAASVAYIAERAPSHMQARAQSLLATTNMAGAVLGVGAGGAIMQYFGARILCVVAAAVLAAVGLTFAVVEQRGGGMSRSRL